MVSRRSPKAELGVRFPPPLPFTEKKSPPSLSREAGSKTASVGSIPTAPVSKSINVYWCFLMRELGRLELDYKNKC